MGAVNPRFHGVFNFSINPSCYGSCSRHHYCQIHIKAITIILMSLERQSHIAPISRFTALVLLFVFTTSLLIPCTSMAAPLAQGSSHQSQAQHHHHNIKVQLHCDDLETESLQLALISPQTDNSKPVFHPQPLYWIELIPKDLQIVASMQGALPAHQWASLISTSSHPSRYLASFQRQLI